MNPAWLRAIRLRAGLSLRQMAEHAKCSAPHLCDIEAGRRGCGEGTQAAYARVAQYVELGEANRRLGEMRLFAGFGDALRARIEGDILGAEKPSRRRKKVEA